MIWALAPGRLADTEMVGKSTWGRGATANCLYAMDPASATAAVSRVVATGRRINGALMFMRALAVEILRLSAIVRTQEGAQCDRR